MLFSPSRAVLSAILRDEYLTSAVRTKEGDKAGSNQPPARDQVQFKLEFTPNYLILIVASQHTDNYALKEKSKYCLYPKKPSSVEKGR